MKMNVYTRPDFDTYFMGIARAVSERADCRRRKAGAVLVRDCRIVSTGYNGSYSGGPSCLAGDCPRGLLSREELLPLSDYEHGPGRCISTHAEANAVLYAGREAAIGATLYVHSGEPCSACLKTIRAVSIARVVYTAGESFAVMNPND